MLGVPEKLITEVLPKHIVAEPLMIAEGFGFTVIVNCFVAPTHPLNFGVIVMVAVIGKLVAFEALKPDKLPEPLAAKPIAVFEFVQS